VSGAAPRAEVAASTLRAVRCGLGCLGLFALGCATLPPERAERSLYLDLRKIAETETGWTIDSLRLRANLEPALRSACEVPHPVRVELDAWLSEQIRLAGGPAEALYAARGHELDATVNYVLSLERTQLLLREAEDHITQCPFWLVPRRDFPGVQGDFDHWVMLVETQAFVTLVTPGAVPAFGGGGRVFLGRGTGPRTTLAVGADLAASATVIPVENHGLGAYVTVATPVLYRWSEFSKLFDVELAPVLRFGPGGNAWPPGARIEVGGGFSSVTLSSVMSYFMLYAGYELHGIGPHSTLDQTFQLGTRLAIDWGPHRN
jgi:hypothetical protein